MTDFARTLELLIDAEIRFIVVGGVAATAHGSARLTTDIDLVYERSDQNLARIENALASYRPRLRGAPPGLPFKLDARTLRAGLNFTLATDIGDLDLLGEITGGGGFEDLEPHAETYLLGEKRYLCLGLAKLIHVKRAAGRPKDLEAIAELEALLEEQEPPEGEA